MVLKKETGGVPPPARGVESSPQLEELNYLGILFTSDDRMEQDTD